MEARYTERMEVRNLTQLGDIDKDDWNRLNCHNNPFLSYEFLEAIERHGCIGADSGWDAHHITLWQENQLVGALPLYSKQHSWGEFVFDFAWANAYAQHGLNYYPKLVSAIPYTPVSGQRFLCQENNQSVKQQLLEAAVDYASKNGFSSWHCLFPIDDAQVSSENLLERWGYQFHWQNNNYSCFNDYLNAMSSSKRKKVRRERRRIEEQGISVHYLSGGDISEQDWQSFYQFYLSTFEKKGNYPAFTLSFFQELGKTLKDQVLLIMARFDNHNVAGAFFMRNETHLYGRHWGCLAEFHSLHFEICYYAAIEYSINNKLKYLDAGAQGEHKISRGFLPIKTRSLHWIAHEGFRHAIEDYLLKERVGVENYIYEISEHSPFKSL